MECYCSHWIVCGKAYTKFSLFKYPGDVLVATGGYGQCPLQRRAAGICAQLLGEPQSARDPTAIDPPSHTETA